MLNNWGLRGLPWNIPTRCCTGAVDPSVALPTTSGVVVASLAHGHIVLRDAGTLQGIPQQLEWNATEDVLEVVPDFVEWPMLAPGVVNERCREEVVLPTKIHRTEALLPRRVALVGVHPPHKPSYQDACVQLEDCLLNADWPLVSRVPQRALLVKQLDDVEFPALWHLLRRPATREGSLEGRQQLHCEVLVDSIANTVKARAGGAAHMLELVLDVACRMRLGKKIPES